MKSLKSELSRTFFTTKWVLSIYFKNYPVLISIFVLTEFILSFGNLLNAYIIALVTDKAIKLAQLGTSNVTDFMTIIILIIGSYLFFEGVRIVNSYSWRMISYQDGLLLQKMLADRLAFLGIQNLENPEVTNKSQRFREEMGNISGYLQTVISIFSSFIAFVSSGIVLINTVPFVALMFTGAMVIQFAINQKFIRLLWVVSRDSTEDRRKNGTSLNLLNEPSSLKELILSHGRNYLLDRVNSYISWMVGKVRKMIPFINGHLISFKMSSTL